MRTALLLSTLGIFLGLGADSSASEEQPELTFRQDGDDLVVTATLTVNNSLHVVLTDFAINPNKEVYLSCCVIQNRDLLVRSQKEVEVEWRLPGHKKGDETYRVESCTIVPRTGELQRVILELQEMMRAGQEIDRIRRD